jgi:hypothetical protein
MTGLTQCRYSFEESLAAEAESEVHQSYRILWVLMDTLPELIN